MKTAKDQIEKAGLDPFLKSPDGLSTNENEIFRSYLKSTLSGNYGKMGIK